MKNFIFSRDGQFSVYGGVLVAGDIEAYRVGVDMGTDTTGMAAIAVCQENGEYNGDYELCGNRIFVTLANSMYSTPGYITIRLAVSKGDSVVTAKEIRFKVAPPNNSDTLAENESGTIDTILASVTRAEAAAQEVLSNINKYALKADTYTKDQIDKTISSVYKYKGSVKSYDELPSYPSLGDVYNVKSAYKAKAYGVNVTGVACEALSFDTETNTSSQRCYLNVDNPSVFTTGNKIIIYDENGNRIGGFVVQHSDSRGVHEYVSDTQGLYVICNYLYEKHRTTIFTLPYGIEVNKMYYFTGISETSESIDVTLVNKEENVVWNGNEWDNLGGIVDLSGYYTKDEVDGKYFTLSNMLDTTNGDVVVLKNNVDNIFANYVPKGELGNTIAPITLKVADLEENTYTKGEVDSKISSVYKYKGSYKDFNTFELDNPYELQNFEVGYVWNMAEGGTIPSVFSATGEEVVLNPGDNIAVVEKSDGLVTPPKFDVLAGTVDLSSYSTTAQVSAMIESAIGSALEGEY